MKFLKKAIINNIINTFLLDLIIFYFAKMNYFFSQLLLIKEWSGINANNPPKFFKHSINFNSWRFDPSEWVWVLRGVKAREKMIQNSKTLDICCGDGSYSFFFYQDISSKIDAIDIDNNAIKYANYFYKHPKINFLKINILEEEFPDKNYDTFIWNAGICYFTIEEINFIIYKIISCGTKEMQLIGMLPKANGHIDHKTEFENSDLIKDLFTPHFEKIEIDYNSFDANFYFYVKQPKTFTNNLI